MSDYMFINIVFGNSTEKELSFGNPSISVLYCIMHKMLGSSILYILHAFVALL